jgi:hypothetical protein
VPYELDIVITVRSGAVNALDGDLEEATAIDGA